MDITVIGILGIIVLLALMLTRMPVGFIMLLVGFAGIAIVNSGQASLGILKTVPFSSVASYNLSVVPLFLLMGELAFQCGLTEKLYATVHRWIGHLRGGLAMATIMGCGIFSAISGSSPATAGAMGKVSLPEMEKYNYDQKLSAASVVAGGSLGNLIPPGVGIVIYGVITEQSIGKLIIACIIPGALLMLLYMLTVYVIALIKPDLAPAGSKYTWKEKWNSLKEMLPIAIIFLITMGGIYTGIFTATEAAAVGAFLTLVYAVFSRNLTMKKFFHCLLETGKVSAMVFTIVIGAMVFGYFLTMTQIPMTVADFALSFNVSKYIIIIFILIIFLLLGMFMDTLAMMLLTIPIFFPVITGLGFDPIWFGVIAVTAMEQGLITPPVGMNLYIVKSIKPDIRLEDIFKGIMPFIAAILVFQALLIIFPQIATFLPGFMTK